MTQKAMIVDISNYGARVVGLESSDREISSCGISCIFCGADIAREYAQNQRDTRIRPVSYGRCWRPRKRRSARARRHLMSIFYS